MTKLVVTSLILIMFTVAPVMADPMTNVIDMSVEVEHKTVHTDHGDEKGGLPQFDPKTFSSQIFWLVIMFVVLYVYFSRAALPKISATIEQRMMTVRADLEQADKLSVEVEKTRSEYEQAMTGAHDEARTYVNIIMTELRAQAQNDTDAFREKSEQEIKSLEAQAEKAKAEIKDELTASLQDITQDIVKTLTPLNLKDADIEKYIVKYMNNSGAAVTTKKAA